MNAGIPTIAMSLSLLLLCGSVSAQEVSDAWIRGTAKGQKATGAFMHIRSGSPLSLVGASSPVAGVVELHEMAMDGSVMKMRAIPKMDVTPGRTLELRPGGYHVMLMDLRRDLNAGERVPLKLEFEAPDKSRKSVDLDVEVKPLTTAPMKK